MSITVHHGDMLQVLPTLAADLFHACVTDPPYHLTSIVKRFGTANAAPAKVGQTGAFARASKGFMGKQWDGGDIAFRPETWAEVLRVMKPGAYIVAFSSSRTFGRMSAALEDAGFITHPMIGWIFGQGFPKATRMDADCPEGWRYGAQAMKPALEPIYLGQKPMEGTGSANWRKHGCGALNIDGCRIDAADKTPAPVWQFVGSSIGANGLRGVRDGSSDALGRWPANLIHDGSDEVLAAFPDAPGQQRAVTGLERSHITKHAYGEFGTTRESAEPRNDMGSAARFFYSAKATAEDRVSSRHPTVKPLSLMRYLCRLVTPLGGLILDPFAGSGTTGHAALAEGFAATLVEREAEYVADIRRRIAHVSGQDAPLFARADTSVPMPLFADAAE